MAFSLSAGRLEAAVAAAAYARRVVVGWTLRVCVRNAAPMRWLHVRRDIVSIQMVKTTVQSALRDS